GSTKNVQPHIPPVFASLMCPRLIPKDTGCSVAPNLSDDIRHFGIRFSHPIQEALCLFAFIRTISHRCFMTNQFYSSRPSMLSICCDSTCHQVLNRQHI